MQTGVIASYEIRPRDVVLYWRGMPTSTDSVDGVDSTYRVTIVVVAAFGGTFVGDASRAYVYYADDAKAWVEGMSVQVTPLQ